jgi:hypothetical protein
MARAAARPAARDRATVRRGRRACCALLCGLMLLSCGAVTACLAQAAPQPGQPPLRKAYVPQDAPAEWPAGNWTPVPMSVLNEFLRDESGRTQRMRPTLHSKARGTRMRVVRTEHGQ